MSNLFLFVLLPISALTSDKPVAFFICFYYLYKTLHRDSRSVKSRQRNFKWKILDNVSRFSDIVYTDVLINDVSVVQGNTGASDSYYVLSEHKVVPTDDDNFSTYINYNCTVYSKSDIDVCTIKYTLKDVINGYEDGRYVFNFKLNDNKNYRINNYSIAIENEGYSAEYKKYNPIFMSDGEMFIFVSAPDEIKINLVLTKWWWILSGNRVGFLLCTMILVVLFIVCFLFLMLLNAVWENLFKKEIYPAILYIGCFILFVVVSIWFFDVIIFK